MLSGSNSECHVTKPRKQVGWDVRNVSPRIHTHACLRLKWSSPYSTERQILVERILGFSTRSKIFGNNVSRWQIFVSVTGLHTSLDSWGYGSERCGPGDSQRRSDVVPGNARALPLWAAAGGEDGPLKTFDLTVIRNLANTVINNSCDSSSTLAIFRNSCK